MQVDAALLGGLPVGGDALVDVRLVDDLGDQLGRMVDCARVWRRQFPAENGVLAAGCDEEAEQSPDAVDGKAEDDGGDEQEDGDASPHRGGWWWWWRWSPFRRGVHGAKTGYAPKVAAGWRGWRRYQRQVRSGMGGGGADRTKSEGERRTARRRGRRRRWWWWWREAGGLCGRNRNKNMARALAQAGCGEGERARQCSGQSRLAQGSGDLAAVGAGTGVPLD